MGKTAKEVVIMLLDILMLANTKEELTVRAKKLHAHNLQPGGPQKS